MEAAAADSSAVANGRRVGIAYDERMCKHSTHDGEPHPENPDRIRVIWDKLQAAGITRRCEVLNAKEAEDRQILLVHGKNHVNLVKNISSKQCNFRRNKIASRWNSIYLNEGSSEAAYLATGSVIEVAEKVARGELNSGFAIVRPPGHHAERDEAMGFCLYNNVAIAASCLLNDEGLGIKKILIVDWDVHHGNGTQKMFYKDPQVLFFSVHRHEFGTFYPGNDDGDYTMIGEGEGAGYNINVPWENGRCGDADYLAVWDHILIPVTKHFNPDMIIVSAGFDAGIADPLGGCRVSPYGYSMMLKQLMTFAGGKIVLALEGGYNLTSIANSALACMEVLLDDKAVERSAEAYPFESTWRVIQEVRKELKTFWTVLADDLPTKLTSKKTQIHARSTEPVIADEHPGSMQSLGLLAIEGPNLPPPETSISRLDPATKDYPSGAFSSYAQPKSVYSVEVWSLCNNWLTLLQESLNEDSYSRMKIIVDHLQGLVIPQPLGLACAIFDLDFWQSWNEYEKACEDRETFLQCARDLEKDSSTEVSEQKRQLEAKKVDVLHEIFLVDAEIIRLQAKRYSLEENLIELENEAEELEARAVKERAELEAKRRELLSRRVSATRFNFKEQVGEQIRIAVDEAWSFFRHHDNF